MKPKWIRGPDFTKAMHKPKSVAETGQTEKRKMLLCSSCLVVVIAHVRFWKFRENPSPSPVVLCRTQRTQRAFQCDGFWLISLQHHCAFSKADCRMLPLFAVQLFIAFLVKLRDKGLVDYWVRISICNSICMNLWCAVFRTQLPVSNGKY